MRRDFQEYHEPGYSSLPQRLTWVAMPPPGAWPPRRTTAPTPYHGPPAYPAVPRWGFPRLSWREPTSVPGTPGRPPYTVRRLVVHARIAMSLLWLLAISALLASAGEVWRYVLLLADRDEALSSDTVALSDTLVNTGAGLAAGIGVVTLVVTVLWLFGVREVAATLTGVRPPRPDWQVLVGILVPVLNVFMAGSILAETENTALGVRGGRPRPSRLVLAWWVSWGVSEVLAVVTLLLDQRVGIQARANGVLWFAATDLVAAVVAVLTVLVVGALTMLIAPEMVRAAPRSRVVRVVGAPAPPLRPARPTGSIR